MFTFSLLNLKNIGGIATFLIFLKYGMKNLMGCRFFLHYRVWRSQEQYKQQCFVEREILLRRWSWLNE